MGMRYKIDVLTELKIKGYHTGKLRRDRILSESSIQYLREGKMINMVSLERICAMLDLQPGDIIEYVPDQSESVESH